MDQLNISNEVGQADEQTTKLAVIELRNECVNVPTSTLGIVLILEKISSKHFGRQIKSCKSFIFRVRTEKLKLPTFRFEVSMIGITKINKDNNLSIL